MLIVHSMRVLLPCMAAVSRRKILPMTGTLQKRVLESISRHSMIRPGDRVGVGVSGGADSVALLHMLADLQTKLGIRISVLHFHHQLRGAEADEDERFVRDLAAKMHFDFVSDRGDVAGEARRNRLNLEDAARRLRYRFFASAAAARELNHVAVAHTADDQAETVLAHLLRGTGLAGLAGIYPVAGLIIRPLIEIGREEVRDYLSGLGQSWREDASNQDTSRTRARIRHQLIPLLNRDFDPSTVTRLARLANLAREEEAFLRALEDDRLAALATQEPSGAISVGIADFLSPLPLLASNRGAAESGAGYPLDSMLALSRRLVRRICAELRGSRQQLTARHVQDVFDLAVKSESGARIELPGICVQKNFDRLIFSPSFVALETQEDSPNIHLSQAIEYAISLPRPSELSCIVVPEIRRRFKLKMIDWPPASGETITARGTLDLDKLRWPVTIRNWRPGDSYRPCGRKRPRKLKRMFLEDRVPRSARAGWPVLISGGQLVWAAGYPVAEEFAPGAETHTGLLIAEEEF
jgi:tRNA(Ile)-lysidine synthase